MNWQSVMPNQNKDSPVSLNITLKHHFASPFKVMTYKDEIRSPEDTDTAGSWFVS